MTDPLTFGSLFAGIGGIDLGLERAGMRCAWQVEIDDYATRVLQKHWPDVPKFRDVRECGAHNLPAIDLIAGGFPCQDISEAGYGAGLDGERSGLWFEFARIIRELRPRYALIENVPALLFRGIDRVLADLAGAGYDAEWGVLSACAFGAPHTRERVFILAYTASEWAMQRRRIEQPTNRETQRYVDSWANQSEPVRMADGVPDRMDRLRGLGNAVVPQVAEFIGRCIVEAQV